MKKQYKEPIQFEEGVAYELPDFTITFIGKTEVEKPGHDNPIVYLDYELMSGDEKTIISRALGGLRFHTQFDFANSQWAMDLSSNDGAVVIVPLEEFDESASKMNIDREYLQ